MIDKGTFGSSKQYISLEHIMDLVNNMDAKTRKPIIKLMTDFTLDISKCNTNCLNNEYKNYVMYLIYDRYISRINQHLVHRFDAELLGSVKRFMRDKIKANRPTSMVKF